MGSKIRLLKRTFRLFSYTAAASFLASTAYVLQKNDFDLSSIGAMRIGRAVWTGACIVVDYKYSLFGIEGGTENFLRVKSGVHKRSAERLLKLACANGGVWIKVGQHCGSLEYLLPAEYVTTLSILHSKAPASSFDDVCRVIRTDLAPEAADELIENMERTPIGSASLAQVHKATLRDGSVVAVKVQHRKVKPNSFVDCTSMEGLVRCAALIFPEFKLMWLAEETKKNLPVELDFVSEGQNADRVRRLFAHLAFLKVPAIHWDYSTDRVLVMEFCEGGQVTDLDYIRKHCISPDDVCKKLGQLYSEMIFVQGCVHCDPHPGNVLVHKHMKKGLQIVLLDHGLYTTLDEDFRLHYSNLWLSLLKADLNGIKEAGQLLKVGELYPLLACMITARSWNSVLSGIDKKSLTNTENDEIKQYVGSFLPQISDVLSRVPRPMLLIFKTNDLLRGIEFSLNVQRSAYSFMQMSKCCVQAVHSYSFKKCDNFQCKLASCCRKYLALTRILCYEVFLNLSSYLTHLRMTLLRLML